jgi:hypothetical protein
MAAWCTLRAASRGRFHDALTAQMDEAEQQRQRLVSDCAAQMKQTRQALLASHRVAPTTVVRSRIILFENDPASIAMLVRRDVCLFVVSAGTSRISYCCAGARSTGLDLSGTPLSWRRAKWEWGQAK